MPRQEAFVLLICPAMEGPCRAIRLQCIRILMVCTGNICRSPTAAGLLAGHAGRVSASSEVKSCGLLPGGRSVPPQVLEAARVFGVDLSAHRSVQISEDLVVEADLVVGMTRHHLREVVLQLPEAWPKTFTLRELIRRGDQVGGSVPDQPLSDWIERLSRSRRRAEVIGDSLQDDVSDPYGGPDEGYRRMVVTLADLIDRLAGMLWPGPSGEHLIP